MGLSGVAAKKPSILRPRRCDNRPMKLGDLEAIVGGYHGDPFAVLGPQSTAKGGWTLRAFLPHARSVTALCEDGRSVELERRHAEGFFEAAFDRTPGRYRLRVETQRTRSRRSRIPTVSGRC